MSLKLRLMYARRAERVTTYNKIIVDGAQVAVEWQFATMNKENGTRQVVSDAIIAEIKSHPEDIPNDFCRGAGGEL